MNGFINHIIDRHTDPGGNISPRLPGRFEPTDIPQNLLQEQPDDNTDEEITISAIRGLAQPGVEEVFSTNKLRSPGIKRGDDIDSVKNVNDSRYGKSREELPKPPDTQHIGTLNNATNPLQNTRVTVPYITKHIEQLIFKENTEVPINPSGNTGLKNAKSTTPDELISSEKKSMIWPSFAAEDSKNINANMNSTNVTRLNPDPKLVIGKITVEIVQPEKTASVKVINRVIHAAPVPDSSKNKLSFGLGQL